MRRISKHLFTQKVAGNMYAIFSNNNGKMQQISAPKYTKIWQLDESIFGRVFGFTVIIDETTGKELVPDDVYTFIGECCSGRRLCKNIFNKSAVMIRNELVSDWFDKVRLEKSFNVISDNGCSFMTTMNCAERISDIYKSIGKFTHISSLGRDFADVIGLNDKYGTVDSNGNEGISCEYENLYPFGNVLRICEQKISDGSSMYAIIAVNGEVITREWYSTYKLSRGKLELTTPDGEVHVYNTLGIREKKR